MKFNKIISVFVIVFALFFIISLGKIVEDVEVESIVINQVPITGTMEYWTTPGLKWQKFGKTTFYKKANQVWFNNINEDANGNLSIQNVVDPAFTITFADKGKGYILGSILVELPTDPDKLTLIQKNYGSADNLFNNLIRPTIGKAILATGPLLTSLESVSEKRNNLYDYITDQLDNGIYMTKAVTVERLNTITGEIEKIQQAKILVDSLGNYLRGEVSPFKNYGLKTSQLAIADIKYESATNNQIAKQREADMNIITSKAEAAQAIQRTIKITEEGKAAAASAKWEQEKIKATAVTKAEQEYEVARLEALKAKEEAKKILEQGRAEAETNRLKVAAGLTPLEKATIEKETAIGVAKALAESQVKWVPEIMVIDGNKNSEGADPMKAVGLNMLLEIAKKQNK